MSALQGVLRFHADKTYTWSEFQYSTFLCLSGEPVLNFFLFNLGSRVPFHLLKIYATKGLGKGKSVYGFALVSDEAIDSSLSVYLLIKVHGNKLKVVLGA